MLTAVLAVMLAAAATAGPDRDAHPAQGGTLTVYSSLPLQGTARDQTIAVVRGARLALAEADGQVGPYTVRYRSLDDARGGIGTGNPRREAANARRAARDGSTIAYIGAFNSRASAVSMPILNRARILQVSPSNTFVGLTRDEPGAGRGEPGKYYPRGARHYVRIVPRDTIQAAALALLMKKRGCRRAFVLYEPWLYGWGMAVSSRRFLRRRGVRVVGFRGVDARQPHYRRLARTVRGRRAGCVVYGGTTFGNAVQLFTDISRYARRAKLFASDGVAEAAFSDPRYGGLPHRVGRKMRITVQTPATSAYGPRGRRFVRRYRARYGPVDPYAIFGYESMKLVLSAIRRAGDGAVRRRAVVAAAFATRRRRSVLGTYSIDRFGDTTLTDYGIYRIARGQLVWDRKVRP